MKEILRRYILPAIAIIIVIGALTVESWLPELAGAPYKKAMYFHPLPENTQLIQKDIAMQSGGGIMTALLLETNLTSEELITFYSDVVTQLQEQGKEVVLDAQALNEESLEAVKQAGAYEEDRGYQFVYIVGQ